MRAATDVSVIVRTPNWLGDTVMAMPALAGLRAGMPEARITAVGRWAGLLAGQGVTDILLPYPARWADRWSLARALREDRADIAILFPNSLESALAAGAWEARRRVGYATDGRAPLLTDALPMPAPRLHQVDEYRALVSYLGVSVPIERPAWRLRHSPAIDHTVSTLLAQAGAPVNARLVGLHLGAAAANSKVWPLPRYGRLAGRLLEAGLTPLLLGGPNDGPAVAPVEAAAGARLATTVGRDSPEILPWLLARLRCLVSGDTGVAHLAAAVGVPTVTLFGPTDQRLTAPRSRRAHLIDRAVPCAPCFLPSCPIDHVCLRSIDVEEVVGAVDRAAGP